MDDIDALFRSSPPNAAAMPPQGRDRGAQGRRVATWPEHSPGAAPHPLEAVQPRLREPSAGGVQALAGAGSRAAGRQAYGSTGAGEMAAGREATADEGRGGWSGGEDERPSGNESRGGSDERDYYSVHIYGGKAALCFQADSTRSGREGEKNTVRLEAAPSRGPRTYSWSDKIAVQFTVKEMPLVLAVFMGWLPSVTFKAHGPQQDKGFSMEHQAGGKMFVKVWQAKNAMAVPLYSQDMYAVVALLLRQMAKNQPFMGVDGVLAVVRQLSTVYREGGFQVQPMPARSPAA